MGKMLTAASAAFNALPMAIDLHSHSSASDGSNSPSDLAHLFAANDVTVAALTDHDTIGGRAEFLRACSNLGIKGIVGIEFSTVMEDGCETHVLGYGLPLEKPEWSSLIDRHQTYLRHRFEETLRLLAKHGYKLDIEQCYQVSGGNPPMPSHIIAALALQGIFMDMSQAIAFFLEYLSKDAKAWVPHETRAANIISALNEMGAISIIAHPPRYPGIDHLEELLEGGAKGFELYYPEQEGQIFSDLERIAAKHNCLVTGGCDFHGAFSQRRIKEIDVPVAAAERLFSAIGEDFPRVLKSNRMEVG